MTYKQFCYVLYIIPGWGAL